MTDDCVPFPYRELAALATYHDEVAAKMDSSFLAGLHIDRASACRNALAAHAGLNERFLEQSMRVRELEAALDILRAAA